MVGSSALSFSTGCMGCSGVFDCWVSFSSLRTGCMGSSGVVCGGWVSFALSFSTGCMRSCVFDCDLASFAFEILEAILSKYTIV